mgnify:CR=1 FL=1
MSFQSFSNGKNVLGDDIKHLIQQKSVFLLVQNFWEGLIPEEELPDLLIMFLRKLLVFGLFYVTKDWFIGCIFFSKKKL